MIKKIWLRNYGPFKDAELALEPLTVIVGPNASGKSIALKALHMLRVGGGIDRVLSSMRKKGSKPELVEVGFQPQKDREVTWRHPLSEEIIRASGKHEDLPGTVLLRLQPQVLREASYLDSDVPLLREDGYGLATVLADMKLTDNDAFASILNHTRRIIPSFEDLLFRRAKVENPRERSVIGNELVFDMKNAPGLRPAAVSDGTLLVLGLLTILEGYTKKDGEKGEPLLVLIDELEHSLHPKALGELVSQLRQLAHESNVQVLATSHSPYLVDWLKPEEVRITSLLEDGSATIRELGDHPEFDRWKEEMKPGEFWSTVGEDWG